MIICPPIPTFRSLIEQGYDGAEIVDMIYDDDSPLDAETKQKLREEISQAPQMSPGTH